MTSSLDGDRANPLVSNCHLKNRCICHQIKSKEMDWNQGFPRDTNVSAADLFHTVQVSFRKAAWAKSECNGFKASTFYEQTNLNCCPRRPCCLFVAGVLWALAQADGSWFVKGQLPPIPTRQRRSTHLVATCSSWLFDPHANTLTPTDHMYKMEKYFTLRLCRHSRADSFFLVSSAILYQKFKDVPKK